MAARSDSHIDVVSVSKSYVNMGRRHTVFSDLSLSFPRGRNTAVLGPNGAGKSTLLRLMTGAEHPEQGFVDRFTRVSWPLAFAGCFNPFLTGIANARFAARLYRADPNFVVDYTREFSSIGDFMDWPVKNYSTGMRARYSFALSMAIDFDCILIDEILGVGDADFKAKCSAALEERRSRCDLVLVTHNLEDAIKFCDRVIILGGDAPIVSDDILGTVKRYSIALTGSADLKG